MTKTKKPAERRKGQSASKAIVSLRASPETQRLGILWVLLNSSIEFKGDVDMICVVMDQIEKYCPVAPRMWNSDFQLVRRGKVIYDWTAS